MPDTKIQTRQLLGDVYAETQAQEFTEGIAGYKLENMIQEELDRLEGPVAGKYRHAVIPYLKDLKERFANAIDGIKATAPEDFAIGEGGAVNADEELPAG
jgi:hypothetical protein